MKFQDVAKGTRARKAVAFPLAETRAESLAQLPELDAQRAAKAHAAPPGAAPPPAPEDEVLVDLRVLTGAEESLVLQRAREYAIERGVEAPKDGDPLYEVGKMAETLALGCIDHDSPEAAPENFFASAKEVLDEMDSDRIAYLFARWELWQGECSPQVGTLTQEQYYATLVQMAVSDDDRPFAALRPATQWALLRTTAVLLLRQPEARSLFTSDSKTKPTGSPGAPPKRRSARASARR